MTEESEWESPWPFFFAWCKEEQRLEAFAAALSELFVAKGGSLGHDGFDLPTLSMADVVHRIREGYANIGEAVEYFAIECPSGRSFTMRARVSADRHLRDWGSPLKISSYLGTVLFPKRVYLAKKRRLHSIEAAAAVACDIAMVDLEDILLRLCTHHPGITTGLCGDYWFTPIVMGASYHADGCVGRDLALSWIRLHDVERAGLTEGLPMATLRERVEAAPRGARISLMDKGTLAREEVLAALALRPDELLEALEAAAVPDSEWLAVEPLAHHALEAAARGEYTVEVYVFTEPHVRFIQHHAPFHVRRLPNGGVLLATHPYRTLWPLWADALDLLGIRPRGSE